MSRIYPDIDNIRRASEIYEKVGLEGHITSKEKLEMSCNQIFNKAPALTKEFLEKMHHAEIGNRTTCVFGYEMKTKQFWLLAGLFLLFFSSLSGAVVMWFTSLFDNSIFSNLVIKDGTTSFDIWQKPSPKPLLRVYVFNYTNLDAFENDGEKLRVKEVGPYVYEESIERVNIIFNSNNSVSYQEQRTYRFRPELSKGHRQSDQVIVPNVPVLSAAAFNRFAPFLQRLAFSGLLTSLNAKPFINLGVHRFLFGYEDGLYDISKSVLRLQNEKPVDQFGLMTLKAGLQQDIYTINTGAGNINKIGFLENFNGKSNLDRWSTEECNRFDATDGSAWPPKVVREKQPIKVFTKESCRSLPLHFEKEVSILAGKIPAYRYSMPTDLFDSVNEKPENQCYCNLESGECPLKGVFNITPCSFGAPMFMSFPHFFNADESLSVNIKGLEPKPDHHKSYVDLHPTMGFAMNIKTRFQVNIQVLKSYGISQLNAFEDKTMLPLAWFEFNLEDKTLPDDIVGIIFQTTFTIKGIELGLKYGCLLTSLVTLVCIFIVMNNRWLRRKRTSSMRPLQRRQQNVDEE